MRTIAVILEDNDFGQTFRPLMCSIRDVVKYWSGDREATEEFIREIIPRAIEFHYLAYQANSHGDFENQKTWYDRFGESYLKHIKILFDDVAEKDILEGGHDGGAWYLEIQSGVVSQY